MDKLPLWLEDSDLLHKVFVEGMRALAEKGCDTPAYNMLVTLNSADKIEKDTVNLSTAVEYYNKMAVASANTGHGLAKYLVRADNGPVECSVDISTGEHDADRRCFGDLIDINYTPSTEGFGQTSSMLLFEGNLNDEEE